MAMNNAFAQQPNALPSKVPSPGAQDQVNPFEQAMSEVNAGQVNVDAPKEAQAEANPFEVAMMEQEPEAPVTEGDGFAPEPQRMEGLPVDIESKPSVGQIVREFWPRVQYAWAGNTREAARALQQSGKFDDVKIDAKDNTIKVKRPGKKGYSSFDFEDFEIMGEIIDASRVIVEGVTEAGLEVAGTAGLALGSAPAGGTGLVAQPAVGATSAVTALTIGDAIAENVMGIERDPERSGLKEKGLAAAFGAGFNFASAGIARRLAAKKAAKSQAKVGVEKVMEDVTQAANEQRILEEAGIRFNDELGAAVVTPAQATMGTNPEFIISERELTKQPGFRNYLDERGKELQQAYQTLTDTLEQKTLGRLTKGEDFKKQFKGIGQYFGENIGRFRTMAKDQISTPQSMNNLSANMGELVQNLDSIPGANLAEKVQGFYGLDEKQAKIFLNRIDEVRNKVSNGSMNIRDIDTLYNSMRKQIDGLMKTERGRGLGHALIKVKNGLRDDYAEAIGRVVPESQKGAYETFMKNYSVFKQGEEALANTLKSSELSKKALVQKLFKGADSLSQIKSLKVVLDQENPKLFRELTTEYFNDLALRNTSGPVGKEVTNWKSMAKQWRNIGEEMQEIILNGSGLTREQIQSMLSLGQRSQGVDIKNMSEEAATALARDFWIASPLSRAGGAAQADAWNKIAKRFIKDIDANDYLKEGGAEAMLKRFPNFKPAQKAKWLEWVDSLPSSYELNAVKGGAVRGAVRSGLRQYSLERDQ